MAGQNSRVRPGYLTLFFLMALFLLRPSLVAAQPEQLLIGLIPEINIFKQKQRYRLLGEYLSKHTGVPVKFTILSRYGNIIDSFTSEEMDGAFFGSFTGALAIRKLGVIPLARPVNHDGSSTYHGLLLVRRESGIGSAKDMRGKRIALVDKATTAGYLFPLAYLRENGIREGMSFFSEAFFTGSHDAAIFSVLEGKADIATAKNTIYDMVEAKNTRIGKELEIIARSPSVPSNGLCVRRDLPESLKEELKKALLELEADHSGKEVLAEFGALRFIETSAEDYRPVFDMADQAGINIKQYSYKNE